MGLSNFQIQGSALLSVTQDLIRLHGDGPILHMLLETALIVEDLIAHVDIFHTAREEEPEEEAVDPENQAGQECAAEDRGKGRLEGRRGDI